MRFARLGDPGGELQWAVLQRGLCSLTRRERLRRLRFARLGDPGGELEWAVLKSPVVEERDRQLGTLSWMESRMPCCVTDGLCSLTRRES